MTDEAFWKRMEEEVLPHVKQNHEEYERFWNEKLLSVKDLNFKTQYDLAYHQWMTVACYLRNFYWEGLQIKSLIEFCAIKCGEPSRQGKTMKDELDERIKEQYENRTRFSLPRRTYTIIRLDGKAFHTYTRDLNKPFDEGLFYIMNHSDDLHIGALGEGKEDAILDMYYTFEKILPILKTGDGEKDE